MYTLLPYDKKLKQVSLLFEKIVRLICILNDDRLWEENISTALPWLAWNVVSRRVISHFVWPRLFDIAKADPIFDLFSRKWESMTRTATTLAGLHESSSSVFLHWINTEPPFCAILSLNMDEVIMISIVTLILWAIKANAPPILSLLTASFTRNLVLLMTMLYIACLRNAPTNKQEPNLCLFLTNEFPALK